MSTVDSTPMPTWRLTVFSTEERFGGDDIEFSITFVSCPAYTTIPARQQRPVTCLQCTIISQVTGCETWCYLYSLNHYNPTYDHLGKSNDKHSPSTQSLLLPHRKLDFTFAHLLFFLCPIPLLKLEHLATLSLICSSTLSQDLFNFVSK